jgi:hypothetical protein
MAISNRARDFWERISPRERRLVVLLGVAVPITLAIWLGLAIRDGLNDMESRNDKMRRALDVVADLQARGITNEPKDDVIAQMGTEVFKLETYLDKAAVKAGFSFKGAVTPTGTIPRNGFVTFSVKVDFGDVTLDQAKTFFQEVEGGSKYVAVTHIDARRNYKAKEKLDFTIEVSTYSREPAKTDSGSAGSGSADKKGG